MDTRRDLQRQYAGSTTSRQQDRVRKESARIGARKAPEDLAAEITKAVGEMIAGGALILFLGWMVLFAPDRAGEAKRDQIRAAADANRQMIQVSDSYSIPADSYDALVAERGY